jgi:hypothetical protein
MKDPWSGKFVRWSRDMVVDRSLIAFISKEEEEQIWKEVKERQLFEDPAWKALLGGLGEQVQASVPEVREEDAMDCVEKDALVGLEALGLNEKIVPEALLEEVVPDIALEVAVSRQPEI